MFFTASGGYNSRMEKILLVRLSSMGDVIHNLPAVTDLARAYPHAKIDWVVDDGFQEIPRLHPAVSRVIPIALRRWKKSPIQALKNGGIGEFSALLRADEYDLILDSQGLIKSALVANYAKGTVAGYDRKSAREAAASLFYTQRHAVSIAQHAIDRNRQLSAQACHYTLEGPVDYGVPAPACELAWLPTTPFAVLLTATSRTDKEWDEANWLEIGLRLAAQGQISILPWGSETERLRSERLAALIPKAICPPRMSLTQAAAMLAAARIVVGVDTGLVHLAAAVATPVVAIFCASDPVKTGVRADTGAVNLGAYGAPPNVETVWQAILAGRRP